MTETRVPRLRAELTTDKGHVIRVPSVPVPAPASSGRITVHIPWPPGHTRDITVVYVKVVNKDLRTALRRDIHPPAVMSQGGTLIVEFEARDVGDIREVKDAFPPAQGMRQKIAEADAACRAATGDR